MLNFLNFLVFTVLDVVDRLLCPIFALLDSMLDTIPASCYCRSPVQARLPPLWSGTSLMENTSMGDGDGVLEICRLSSETLDTAIRRSSKKQSHLFPLDCNLGSRQTKDTTSFDDVAGDYLKSWVSTIVENGAVGIENRGDQGAPQSKYASRDCGMDPVKTGQPPRIPPSGKRIARWSDCGCERCTFWQSKDEQGLHVVVDDKDFLASVVNEEINIKRAENNVIFLHGFLSSSSFWVDTVMPALPTSVRSSHRLFAVDILGFGKSPKPSTSLYTIADHIDMIQRSVLEPHGIQSFHVVAHSMGCTIALALAAHDSSVLKSITLVAPPYFPAAPGIPPGTYLMQQVAARRIWPLMAFGTSVMSWYEHIGRVVCFVVCKNHRFWEPLLYLLHSKLQGKRVPLSCVTDFTQHTHHAAWHIFHNTICNGGLASDQCLKVLLEVGIRVRVIHGIKDSVIPFKGSVILSQRYPNVVLTAVPSATHGTVVFGREGQLAKELAEEILYKYDLQGPSLH